MEKNFEFFKKTIENKGYKFTKQIQLVLKVLIESKTHLNVEEIYYQLKHYNIGLATIYRSVKKFNELGIVKKINISGMNYYEMKIYSKKPLHIHFRCLNCNEIIDIDNNSLAIKYIKLNNKIQEENNIDIYDVDILFKGLCNKCRG